MRMIRAVRLPMLTTTAKRPALRKATNLSVNSVLLAEAKRLKLNLSQVLETSLTQAVREKQREEWLEVNRTALAAYNAHIEKHGAFSDGLRLF